MLEYVQRCDAAGCERHVMVRKLPGMHFLTVVREGEGELHFCGWDCVLRFGAEKEPETIVEAGEGP